MADFSSHELAKALRDAQKLIYGVDDRREAFEITDSAVKKSATGVASLIDVVDIEDNGDDTSTIRTVRFGDATALRQRTFSRSTDKSVLLRISRG